jgi:hypothetical protein
MRKATPPAVWLLPYCRRYSSSFPNQMILCKVPPHPRPVRHLLHPRRVLFLPLRPPLRQLDVTDVHEPTARFSLPYRKKQNLGRLLDSPGEIPTRKLRRACLWLLNRRSCVMGHSIASSPSSGSYRKGRINSTTGIAPTMCTSEAASAGGGVLCAP